MEKKKSSGTSTIITKDELAAEGGTEHYQHAASTLVWWAAGSFAVIIGFSRLSYGLLVPAIRADLQGSYGTYGLVGTANFAGYLLGTLLIPPLLTRYGNRIRLNIIALLGMNLAMLASATSLDLWQLGFWRGLIGFFSALATVLSMALLLERIYPAERGRATGLIWMGGSLGIVVSGLIAPPIISTGSALAWRIVWSLMGLAGLVAAFGTHRNIKRTNPPAPVVARSANPTPIVHYPLSAIIANLFRLRGLLFLTFSYFSFGFGYIIYSTYFISLLKEEGLPEVLAGLIWAVTGATGVFGGFLWGRATDRYPNGFTLSVALFIGASGGLLVLINSLAVQFVGAALLGLALIGAPVITTVLLKHAVPGERYTSSFSFLTALFAIGQTIGPLFGGIVVDSLHNSGSSNRDSLEGGLVITTVLLGLSGLFAVGYGLMQRTTKN